MTDTAFKLQRLNSFALAAIFTLGALTFAAQASAGCMDSLLPHGKSGATADTAQFQSAVYWSDAESGAHFIQVDNREQRMEPIVGLWEFRFDGLATDFGTQAWHDDGTEIMFSAGQDPATGDICQGVWRKIGKSTYTLNHIALGWVAPGGPFGLRIHFHAVVQVDPSGNSYTGEYSVDIYAVSPADATDESNLVVSGGGNMTGTRVQPD